MLAMISPDGSSSQRNELTADRPHSLVLVKITCVPFPSQPVLGWTSTSQREHARRPRTLRGLHHRVPHGDCADHPLHRRGRGAFDGQRPRRWQGPAPPSSRAGGRSRLGSRPNRALPQRSSLAAREQQFARQPHRTPTRRPFSAGAWAACERRHPRSARRRRSHSCDPGSDGACAARAAACRGPTWARSDARSNACSRRKGSPR